MAEQPQGRQREQPAVLGEDFKYVAIIENRAREVGIATLDFNGCLYLSQINETNRSYTATLMLLQIFQPISQLLICSSTPDLLEVGVNGATIYYPQIALIRAAFDDSQGHALVSKYTGEALNELTPGTYLAYGCAGALLRWLASEKQITPRSLEVAFLTNDTYMQMDAATVEALELTEPHKMSHSLNRKNYNNNNNNSGSLFSFLDATCTRAGSRLLRANLLQPLRDIPTINARLNAVSELVVMGHDNDDLLLSSTQEALSRMPKDMDRVLSNLTLVVAKSESGTLRRIATFIQSFILLKDLLQTLPLLAEALEHSESSLLQAARNAALHPSFKELLQQLDLTLEENATSYKNAFMNKTQQCYAVKAGANGLLDVARGTFGRLTEQVHELADEYRCRYDLDSLKVQYNAKRGFYFTFPTPKYKGGGGGGRGRGRGRGRGGRHQQLNEGASRRLPAGMYNDDYDDGGDDQQGGGRGGYHPHNKNNNKLPACFVLSSTETSKSRQYTTAELNALNARLTEASNDCIVLTEQVLDGLSKEISTNYVHLLRRLVDNIAMLDMLCAFARVTSDASAAENDSDNDVLMHDNNNNGDGDVIKSMRWTRPLMIDTDTKVGMISIKEGRHPVLEALGGWGSYRSNDALLSLHASCHIITGPNMSGKTTFLKQVAIISIIAQIGCYVPASSAIIAPLDRIMSRLGAGDCLETNKSSFMIEMTEVSHILDHATPRSLVLIDELGRATSTADGVAIAWAVAERLIEKGVPTLFSTHFPQLCDLGVVYASARSWKFDVDTSKGRLEFSWRLKERKNIGNICVEGGGVDVDVDVDGYGLLLAEGVGFSEEVMVVARQVAAQVKAAEHHRSLGDGTKDEDLKDKKDDDEAYDAVYEMARVVWDVENGGVLDEEAERAFLERLVELKKKKKKRRSGG
jgi:DNA mismatch repair protein MSH4